MDFPQFGDICHLIPQVLDPGPKFVAQHNYPRIEDSEKWEIYIKYRKIVSQILTDPTRSLIDQGHSPSFDYDTLEENLPEPRSLFVGKEDC